jgi:hypothetical protein
MSIDVQDADRARATRPVTVEGVAERRITPVKWWAAAGGLFLALQLYLYGAWILSGNAHSTPRGSTPVPGWMVFSAYAHEVVSVIGGVVCTYIFLIRPWRRDRRIGIDGMIAIAWVSTYWQDALSSYFQPYFSYNAAFHNWGAWYNFVPGWASPNIERLAEPAIFALPSYIWVFVPVIIGVNALMRRAKARWPAIGKVGLASLCFVFMALADLVIEVFWARLGLYSFVGAVPGLTLFPGKYYQFPIYNSLFWGAVWTALACLRYFRDDRGYTVAEAGIDRIRATPRQKSGLRVLSMIGIFNVVFLFLFNVPVAWITASSGSWPKDVVTRSYLNNGLCGPDTTYACPDPSLPLPRRGSRHVDPDGKLVTTQD